MDIVASFLDGVRIYFFGPAFRFGPVQPINSNTDLKLSLLSYRFSFRSFGIRDRLLSAMTRPKPLVLIILDVCGYRAETKANAIALARKPVYDRLLREYPNTLIHTSGPFVGLPEGQMGNSEVGHLNIGAGRIVHMDITRIDLMIQNGELFSHPVLLTAMKHARVGDRRLHVFGLVSDGGVHSQQAHLYALLKMARQNGVDRVFVHAFMDGRDTLPTNGAGYLEQLQQKMREYNSGKMATTKVSPMSLSSRSSAPIKTASRWRRFAMTMPAFALISAPIVSGRLRG